MPSPTNIQTTLTERGARYGDFTDHARIADHLQRIMSNHFGGEARWTWENMAPYQRQALRVIADKIARILNGDPNYPDSWLDIIGYATLVLERLPPSA